MKSSGKISVLKLVYQKSIPHLIILIFVSLLSYAAIIYPLGSWNTDTNALSVGTVAGQDILAPYPLSYQSDYLTKNAQGEAEKLVSAIYLPADPDITRRQIEKLRVSLSYINSVRMDSYAATEQKIEDLALLADIRITNEIGRQILALDSNRWQAVQQETSRVLEQVMRNTIREDRINEIQRSVPTLVSFSLPPDQSQIVVNLVTGFISPNSLYSDTLTQQAKNDARLQIQPIKRTFIEGETIVRRGQIITEIEREALQHFNLIQQKDQSQKYLAAAIIVMIFSAFCAFYFRYRKTSPIFNLVNLLLITLLFVAFLAGARLSIPNRTVIPYLFPIPAFGLTIACLFDMEISLVLTFILSIFAAYGLPNSMDLTLYYLLPGLAGVLVLGNGNHISKFFVSGLTIGAAGASVILVYRLTNSLTDIFGLTTLVGSAFFNGLASASLALLFQFIFAQLLGLTTALRLLEISRPDSSLLQFILRNAPGTYQHSLQVANLAEQAAEAIGADTLLVRVGAIYHDAGKALTPSLYIENQIPGSENPHDKMDPITSAATIIKHVGNGITLARKYRLPPRIQDFIREHHGTLLTRYQYTNALKQAGGNSAEINPEQFRYPGPSPRSRETILLMLADGVEAKARAEHPRDEKEIRTLVNKVFDYIQKEGQLDQTSMTFQDLNRTFESFVSTLQNTYHPRIQYPEMNITVEPGEKIRN